MLRNCLCERGGALSGDSEDKVMKSLKSETLESELSDDEKVLLLAGSPGVEEAWGRMGASFRGESQALGNIWLRAFGPCPEIEFRRVWVWICKSGRV